MMTLEVSSFLSSWWIGNNMYSTICCCEIVLEFGTLILVKADLLEKAKRGQHVWFQDGIIM